MYYFDPNPYNHAYVAEFDYKENGWRDHAVPLPGKRKCAECGRSTNYGEGGLGMNTNCLQCCRIMFNDHLCGKQVDRATREADAFGAAQNLIRRRQLNWTCSCTVEALRHPEFVQAWAERLPEDYTSEPNFPQDMKRRPKVALGYISGCLDQDIDVPDSGNEDMMKHVPQVLHGDMNVLVPAFGAMDYEAYVNVNGWQTNVKLAALLFADRLPVHCHVNELRRLEVKIDFFRHMPQWFLHEKVDGVSRADRVVGEVFALISVNGQPDQEWLNLNTREEVLHAKEGTFTGEPEMYSLGYAIFWPLEAETAPDLPTLKRTDPFLKAFFRSLEPRGKQLWYKAQTAWAQRSLFFTLYGHFTQIVYDPNAADHQRDRAAYDTGGIEGLPERRVRQRHAYM